MTSEHGPEVGVGWENGLVLHENDAEWHPWDESVYGVLWSQMTDEAQSE